MTFSWQYTAVRVVATIRGGKRGRKEGRREREC